MQQKIINYCPCGCQKEDLDELGYCRHLQGFTNDGRTFEPTQAVKDRNGEFVRWRTNGKAKKPVLKTDTLVNPEYAQIDNGIVNMAKTWVSARVYRDVTPESVLTDAELEQLTAPAVAA